MLTGVGLKISCTIPERKKERRDFGDEVRGEQRWCSVVLIELFCVAWGLKARRMRMLIERMTNCCQERDAAMLAGTKRNVKAKNPD